VPMACRLHISTDSTCCLVPSCLVFLQLCARSQGSSRTSQNDSRLPPAPCPCLPLQAVCSFPSTTKIRAASHLLAPCARQACLSLGSCAASTLLSQRSLALASHPRALRTPPSPQKTLGRMRILMRSKRREVDNTKRPRQVRQEEQEATAAAECKHTATAAAAAKPPLLLLQQHHPSLDALNTKASDAILPPHLRSCHVCGGGGTPDGLTPTNSVQHLSVYADELGAGRGGWLGAVGGAGMGGHGTPVVYVATAHEPQQQRPLAGGAWAAGGDVTPRLRERSSSSTQQCGDAGKGLCSHSPESFMAKGLEWRMASSELGLNKGGGARGKRSWREGTSREEREREEREEPMPSAIVRLLLSVVWAMGVVCTSAGVMTFVHDRVPDMQKYPPLPDIVLDHIPLIPWAFEASEVCIAMLALLFFFTVIFHRSLSPPLSPPLPVSLPSSSASPSVWGLSC
jgi:hypothetical protein